MAGLGEPIDHGEYGGVTLGAWEISNKVNGYVGPWPLGNG